MKKMLQKQADEREGRCEMNEDVKSMAASKGARTDLDFLLFATLVGQLAQISDQLNQLDEPGQLSELQGMIQTMILKHKYLLERGRVLSIPAGSEDVPTW